MSATDANAQIEPHIRRVLRDCRKLYATSAELMIRRHPTLLGPTAGGFAELMEDLHRGLLIKVFTTSIRADGRWTGTEKFIGALIIEHIWDEHLRGSALREASEKLFGQSNHLSWSALVAPFAKYEPLRDMVGQLETVVMRLANLIIKSDGLTTPDETESLHKLQSDLSIALNRSVHKQDSRSTPPSQSDQAVPQAVRGKPGTKTPDRTTVQRPELSPEQRFALAMEELNQLIGITAVKERIQSLSNFLKLQRQRQSAGLTTMPISLHMSFVGNPGTGKTTVARIVGQLLGSMGVLSSGHLVETDRGGLVAEYAGQTAVKTNQLCDTAKGGVLFIDEAYSLVDANDDSFGREAVQTLLKRMEDDRSDMVVILAGYPDEMDKMIRSNPGLSSRINTRIQFDDYGPADLGRIFELLCSRNDYSLPPDSRHRLLIAFDQVFRNRDRHFGNGRLARNCFEDTVRCLADRIAGIVPLTAELMTTLTPVDISVPGVTKAEIDNWIAQPHQLRTSCLRCGKRLRVKGNVLGRLVRCPACEHEFTSPWADVER